MLRLYFMRCAAIRTSKYPARFGCILSRFVVPQLSRAVFFSLGFSAMADPNEPGPTLHEQVEGLQKTCCLLRKLLRRAGKLQRLRKTLAKVRATDLSVFAEMAVANAMPCLWSI